MCPDIVFLGKTFTPYLIFALAGALTVLLFTYKTAQRNQIDEIKTLYTTLFAFVGVFLGGHIMYGITNATKLASLVTNLGNMKSFKDFLDHAIYIFGGSVFYGGMIGAVIAGYIYLTKTKTPLEPYADLGAMGIPLFHFFGRLGCFFSGCCYGVECDFGFVYHHSKIADANGVARFPIQLCEAAFNLILFALLFLLFKKGICRGRLLAVYLIAYPVARFCFEFFRGDEIRGFVGPLSTSQFISILLVISTVVFLLRDRLKANKKD